MLLHCEIGDEYTFFEKVWKLLTNDIQYNFQKMIAHPNYRMTDTEFKDHLIENLATLFYKFGSNIHDFNLPRTSNSSGCQSNHFIDEELCDDIDNLLLDSQTMISQLNNEQLQAFNTIIDVVLANKYGFSLFLAMVVPVKHSYGIQSLHI
jgi:hypothetical protein